MNRQALTHSSALVLVAILTSCSSLPTDYPRTASSALQRPVTTGVSGILQREAAKHPGKSGFAILEGNREAFTDRVALADFAQKTLDIQYYIWSADTIGRMLGERILKAADRGVRVRFLLDDHSFKDRDSAVAALAAHPQVEVRIFNPYKHRSLRAAEFAFNFSRLNKRMHNKIMVMDNSAVIVGGRNIADEYFGLSGKYNNRDLDIAAVGPIVEEISETFDEFWNSPAAIPIEALVKESYDLDDFYRQIARLRTQIKPGHYPYPLDADVATLRKRIETMSSNLTWAHGEVIYDSFASMHKDRKDETVASKLSAIIQNARREVAIESAYFVVRDGGVDLTRALTSRGVKVRALTNSLASNNVLAAQAGHSKRRKKLLKAGMEVYELRPDAAAVLEQVAPEGRDSISTLHTKTVVIDREKAFVGSYNLDPRSADINSEIGILVDDPRFAHKVAEFLDTGVAPENAYHLTIDEKNRLRWQTLVDGKSQTWSKDPETSGFQRFKAGFIEWLPIENQL